MGAGAAEGTAAYPAGGDAAAAGPAEGGCRGADEGNGADGAGGAGEGNGADGADGAGGAGEGNGADGADGAGGAGEGNGADGADGAGGAGEGNGADGADGAGGAGEGNGADGADGAGGVDGSSMESRSHPVVSVPAHGSTGVWSSGASGRPSAAAGSLDSARDRRRGSGAAADPLPAGAGGWVLPSAGNLWVRVGPSGSALVGSGIVSISSRRPEASTDLPASVSRRRWARRRCAYPWAS